MRIATAAVVGFAGLIGVFAPTAHVSADGWPCGVAGAQLLRESRTAIVAKRAYESGRVQARYYGCLRSTGRPVVVTEYLRYEEGDVREVWDDSTRVSGRFVLVVTAWCLGECGPPRIGVHDLRSGRRVKAFDARGIPEPLFLTSRGAVVYADADADETLVYVADAAGHRRVAAGSEKDLPLKSVRIRGHRLQWRFRGSEESLQLR